MTHLHRPTHCIVLIGLSGSGKSTVGRYLAQRLNYPLYDTDAIIEAEAGKTASEMFAQEGEVAFRQRESAVLARVLNAAPCVVATGGGIVTVPANCALIRERAFVVWLDATSNAIIARISNHRQPRPLLQGDNPRERLETMRQNRAHLYRSIADLHMLTDGIHANAVAQRIAMLLPGASPTAQIEDDDDAPTT
jgi:shikimate kinase